MDYGVMDYGDMNWLAIVCAGLAYWLLGAVWYSALFSKVWRSAVEQHGVKLGQPNQSGMATKLIVTRVCNLIAALILARVIHQLHGVDLLRGLKINADVGLGFCATALTMTYIWQSRRGDSGRSIQVITSSAALSWALFCRLGASLTVIGHRRAQFVR